MASYSEISTLSVLSFHGLIQGLGRLEHPLLDAVDTIFFVNELQAVTQRHTASPTAISRMGGSALSHRTRSIPTFRGSRHLMHTCVDLIDLLQGQDHAIYLIFTCFPGQIYLTQQRPRRHPPWHEIAL